MGLEYVVLHRLAYPGISDMSVESSTSLVRFSGSMESCRLWQTFRILVMYGILVFLITLQEFKKWVVDSCSSLQRRRTYALLLLAILDLERWYLFTNNCTLAVALHIVGDCGCLPRLDGAVQWHSSVCSADLWWTCLWLRSAVSQSTQCTQHARPSLSKHLVSTIPL